MGEKNVSGIPPSSLRKICNTPVDIQMDESYRSAVCTRVASLASEIFPNHKFRASGTRVVERSIPVHVPCEVRRNSAEMLVIGAIVGMLFCIFSQVAGERLRKLDHRKNTRSGHEKCRLTPSDSGTR
jgi:hypothetical protein